MTRSCFCIWVTQDDLLGDRFLLPLWIETLQHRCREHAMTCQSNRRYIVTSRLRYFCQNLAKVSLERGKQLFSCIDFRRSKLVLKGRQLHNKESRHLFIALLSDKFRLNVIWFWVYLTPLLTCSSKRTGLFTMFTRRQTSSTGRVNVTDSHR